jgi:hypothetical protein
MLLKSSTEVCEPYEFEKENASTGEIEIIKKLSDTVYADRSLLKLVKVFLSRRPAENGVDTTAEEGIQVVIDEDEDQQSEDEEIVQEETANEGQGEEAAYEQLNSELQAQQQVTAEFLRSKKNKKQHKWREWRMDLLRLDDLS